MTHSLPRHFVGAILAAAFLGALAPSALAQWSEPTVATPPGYKSSHPRLLFTRDEVSSLRTKVTNGGRDDAAYSFMRSVVLDVYPYVTLDSLLHNDFALEAIPNMGLVSFLDTQGDTIADNLGKALTLYIADNWAVDTSPYDSGLRLRALALGYDLFFARGSKEQRTYVRNEIISYLNYMTNNFSYEVWSHRPYLSNKGMMVAASLGLAAICLDGEADPVLVQAALQRADALIDVWLEHHIDAQGAGVEGALYTAWSLRNLIYYFHARLRYDGTDYGTNPKIRNLEKWFAYELDPLGGGKVNNIQDCTWHDLPLPRHTTYFDWAQSRWGSGLSAYIWEHVAGIYGVDKEDFADKLGTVLWNRDLPRQQPDAVLPASMLWADRGLYYYRSGWPTQAASNDVVFSFYSGKFQGGHAQEDQNQFTLTAYGAKFAVDHGPGNRAKESEAHNIMFIDGKGQHNAGSSIGTDGQIVDYLSGSFADYIVGDATSAYTTHSPFNNPDVPFPGTDWSWGYRGANPVRYALRKILAVHDSTTAPYFLIADHIDKDGLEHVYEWRMHTHEKNVIELDKNPIRIRNGTRFLDVHVMNPHISQLTRSVTFFDNGEEDPDSRLLSLSARSVKAGFSIILAPNNGVSPPPTVSSSSTPFGVAAVVTWRNGPTDLLLVNEGGEPVATSLARTSTGIVGLAGDGGAALAQGSLSIETDASMALIRFRGADVDKYLVADATSLAVGSRRLLHVVDGAATVAVTGREIHIDRADADFAIFSPGGAGVFWRGTRIAATRRNDYVTAGAGDGPAEPAVPAAPRLAVRAHPNPFNPSTRILVDLAEETIVHASVYDPAGRLVRQLWNGALGRGANTLRWDGRDDKGTAVASGVYLLKVQAGSNVRTLKLTLLK